MPINSPDIPAPTITTDGDFRGMIQRYIRR